MICTGVQGQTALDFYLTLSSREKMEDCRGPIVYLELAKPIVETVVAAMSAIGAEKIINNAYITRMVSNPQMALFGSCAAHWMDISSTMSVVGSHLRRSDLISIGRSLFLHMCEQVDWDSRELDNYMRSAMERRS